MGRVRVGVVALVLVSAVCLGLDSGGTHSNGGASPLPPGVDNGSLNATALTAAHERSLVGTPVAIETTRATWDTDPGGNQTVTTDTLTDGNGTLWRRTVTGVDEQAHVERWTNGRRSLRYGAATGETRSAAVVTKPGQRYLTTRLAMWLDTGRYSLTAVESATPGRYVLTTTTYTPPDGEPLEADTVRYEATAVVTASGRVQAMSATLVTIETNRWGRHVRSRSYSYRVVRTGDVTPPTPDWLPDRSAAAVEGDDG